MGHVQGIASSGSSTLTLTFPGNTTAGNLICVLAGGKDAITSIGDGTNIYTLDKTSTTQNSHQYNSYYAKNIAGGAVTITINYNTINGGHYAVAHEVSGEDTVSPYLDSVFTSQTGISNGTDAITTSAINVATNGYLFGVTLETLELGSSVSAGTGFSAGENTTFILFSEYDDTLTTGTKAVTGTSSFGGSADFITLAMSFQPSGGSGQANVFTGKFGRPLRGKL